MRSNSTASIDGVIHTSFVPKEVARRLITRYASVSPKSALIKRLVCQPVIPLVGLPYHVHPPALPAPYVSCVLMVSLLSAFLTPSAVSIRPQSLQLGTAVVSATKKLHRRSQTLSLRVPTRSSLRRSHVVVAGVALTTSVSLLLHESALCQAAMTLAAAVRVWRLPGVCH